MKNIKIGGAIVFILSVSCGPSQEDEIAADRGCRLVERYEEMKASKGSDQYSFKEDMFIGAMNDYVNLHASSSNAGQVRKLMLKNCGAKAKLFDEIFKTK